MSHDARGNLTSDGSRVFGYTSENRLATAPGNSLYYDALGRLFHISGSGTDLRYDSSEVIEENEAYTGAIRRRYVHGAGVDEPLVSYDSDGSRRWLHADERGSIIATSDQSGTAIHISRYDEHGATPDGVADRFGYTGQMWLPEIGVYHYKARAYDPNLPRFLQTDPSGYAPGMNVYGYAGGDAVNFKDPSGRIQIYSFCTAGGNGVDADGGIWILAKSCTYSTGPSDTNNGRDDPGNGCHPLGRGGAPVCRPEETEQNVEAEIVIVAKRTTRLPNVLPRTLWNHFLGGTGDTVCLTSSQFGDLAGSGKRIGNLAARAGGGYTQQTSYYGGSYANSFGTASIYLDQDFRMVGFHDYYNFDAHGRTSISAQIKTAIGALGYLANGKDFSIDYNNGACR